MELCNECNETLDAGVFNRGPHHVCFRCYTRHERIGAAWMERQHEQTDAIDGIRSAILISLALFAGMLCAAVICR